jgi:farnesyl diphosphate synthase
MSLAPSPLPPALVYHAPRGGPTSHVRVTWAKSGRRGKAVTPATLLDAEGRYAEKAVRSPTSPGEVRRLQAMKTGALLAAAVEMGAILGGASLGQRMSLSTFGQALGACFQVADDVLDVEASPDIMGKATAKDADANKATLVAAIGLEAARAERDRLATDAISALRRFGPEADTLRAAARFAAERAN